MSLVGPRPSPFRENQVCVPWREGRLSVRPGITGLWQICRHDRDKGDFHQWIYFDLLYVRHLSFWLDTKILALTPLSFLRSGYIPLRWLLAPSQYGERRAARREAEREGRPAAGMRRPGSELYRGATFQFVSMTRLGDRCDWAAVTVPLRYHT